MLQIALAEHPRGRLKAFSLSLHIWVVLSAAVVAADLFLAYRSVRESEAAAVAVDHARDTLSSLVALEGAIGDLVFASSDQAIARASEASIKRVDELSALTLADDRQHPR